MEHKTTFASLSRPIYDNKSRRLVDAELQLKICLCDWVSKDHSPQLRAICHEYLDFMERHIDNAEQLFIKQKVRFFGLSNRLMQTHIEEIKEKLANCSDITGKEELLVAGMLAISDFKAAAYGMAAAFASATGFVKAAELFNEASLNEKKISERLVQLASNKGLRRMKRVN